jgi:hypothetical protein
MVTNNRIRLKQRLGRSFLAFSFSKNYSNQQQFQPKDLLLCRSSATPLDPSVDSRKVHPTKEVKNHAETQPPLPIIFSVGREEHVPFHNVTTPPGS